MQLPIHGESPKTAEYSLILHRYLGRQTIYRQRGPGCWLDSSYTLRHESTCSAQNNPTYTPYHPSYSHPHSHCLSYHHNQDPKLKMSQVSGIPSSLYFSKLLMIDRPITTLTPSSAKLTELAGPAPRASRSCMVFGTPY
jgi:hypothetical protein